MGGKSRGKDLSIMDFVLATLLRPIKTKNAKDWIKHGIFDEYNLRDIKSYFIDCDFKSRPSVFLGFTGANSSAAAAAAVDLRNDSKRGLTLGRFQTQSRGWADRRFLLSENKKAHEVWSIGAITGLPAPRGSGATQVHRHIHTDN